MYSWIGFSGASASRKRSWATMEAETDSSTAPLRQIMRSFYFCFFNVNKILSQQAREGGMGARWGKKGFAGREASFCATLIEDEVVGVLCVVYH